MTSKKLRIFLKLTQGGHALRFQLRTWWTGWTSATLISRFERFCCGKASFLVQHTPKKSASSASSADKTARPSQNSSRPSAFTIHHSAFRPSPLLFPLPLGAFLPLRVIVYRLSAFWVITSNHAPCCRYINVSFTTVQVRSL